MKTLFFALVSLLMGWTAQARPVPETYATCQGKLYDGTAVTFTVREMAVVGLAQGLLQSEADQAVSLTCRNSTGSSSKDRVVMYVCTENRAGDGKVSVRLEYGFSGHLIGQIQREQMFPLPAQTIGHLFCR
nr:hypothetical protein BdHM001_25150 [Bdellovibrio sp. HM001]